MDQEQCETLGKQIKRAAKSDKPYFWAYIAECADDKPALFVFRKQGELKDAFKAAKKTAKDKKFVRGRTVKGNDGLKLGVDEGSAPVATMRKDLIKIAKEPGLKKVKSLIDAVEVLEGEAWAQVAPGQRVEGGMGVTDEGLDGLNAVDARAKGGTIKKQTGDYGKLVAALEKWRDDLSGSELTPVVVDQLARELTRIDGLARTWEENHKKGLFQLKKTKDRREAVAEIRQAVLVSRAILEKAVEIATVRELVDLANDHGDAWDASYHALPEGSLGAAHTALQRLQGEATTARNHLQGIDAPQGRKAAVGDLLDALEAENLERQKHYDDHVAMYPRVSTLEDHAREFDRKYATVDRSNIAAARTDVEVLETEISDTRRAISNAPTTASWATPRVDIVDVRRRRQLEDAAIRFYEADEVDPLATDVEKFVTTWTIVKPGDHGAASRDLDELVKARSETWDDFSNTYDFRSGHGIVVRKKIDAIEKVLAQAAIVVSLAPLLAAAEAVSTGVDDWANTHEGKLVPASVDDATSAIGKLKEQSEKAREQIEDHKASALGRPWLTQLDVADAAIATHRAAVELFAVELAAKSLPGGLAGIVTPVAERLAEWDEAFAKITPENAGRARGGLEGIELAIASARTDVARKEAPSEEIAAAGRALDQVAEGVAKRKQRVDVAVFSTPPTPQELEQFDELERKARGKALDDERQSRIEWNDTVDDGLTGGRYEVQKKIGEGGLGTVYLMTGKKGDPDLACKTANDEELQHEREVYEKLGSHPNIVRCEGIRKIVVEGVEKEVLVMEAMKGGNMEDLLQKGKIALSTGKLTALQYWGGVQYMARSMLRALQHLDDNGLSHNDIKPENMMMDHETGELKLVDMGTVLSKDEHQKFGTVGFLGLGKGESRDAFAVGGSVFQAGQTLQSDESVKKSRFDYDGTPVTPWGGPYATVTSWTEGAVKVLRKGATGKASKSSIGVSTAYSDWVNKMMAPDEKKRLTFAEALAHPFLADMVISEKEAKSALKELGKG